MITLELTTEMVEVLEKVSAAQKEAEALAISPKPTNAMRILWLSNHSRVGTGYGNQTNLFTKMLKDAGHEIVIVPFYGLEGAPEIDHNGILNLPRAKDLYGNDVMEAHSKYTNAEAVITLIDPWVLDETMYARMPWIAWTPIDSDPILPALATSLTAAKQIWAMSRFGEAQLSKAKFANVDYVPHGIDTEAFKPIDRSEARVRLGKQLGVDLTGKFLVTANSANKGIPGRKGFFEMFSSFAAFASARSDALLYVHTDMYGSYGEHLPTVVGMFGDALKGKVIFADPYLYISGMHPSIYLNDVYNAGDVFLTTSHGEGFGIPIVEAQAAGSPVIVTDFSAMSELCFSGWKVPGYPFMHSAGATQRIPVIPMVADALNKAYAARADQSMRDRARQGAMEYDSKRVFEQYMVPALAKMSTPKFLPEAQAKARRKLRKQEAKAQRQVAANVGR